MSWLCVVPVVLAWIPVLLALPSHPQQSFMLQPLVGSSPMLTPKRGPTCLFQGYFARSGAPLLLWGRKSEWWMSRLYPVKAPVQPAPLGTGIKGQGPFCPYICTSAVKIFAAWAKAYETWGLWAASGTGFHSRLAEGRLSHSFWIRWQLTLTVSRALNSREGSASLRRCGPLTFLGW